MNKQLPSELLGTFTLVFAGTRAIIINDVSGGVIVLEAMFAGPICGASMNPARSLPPRSPPATSSICGPISWLRSSALWLRFRAVSAWVSLTAAVLQ